MKTIVVLSNNYPSQQHPTRGVFVYNLIKEFSKKYKVVVISLSPIKFNNLGRQIKLDEDPSKKVFYPKHLSFSSLIYRSAILNSLKDNSAKKVMEAKLKNLSKPYFIYAHFLGSAMPALDYVKANRIPLFVALGESSVLPRYKYILGNAQIKNQIGKKINGIISVSEKLQKFANTHLEIPLERILVSPNATDINHFYPSNSRRKELNLPKNKFIVAFVGSFIERKGINLIIEASKRLPEVGFILIGNGSLTSKTDNILLSAPLSHSEIPLYLNSSDAFIFPTKAEGSSNAIAEAMACGLPVISSDIPEVIDQIGRNNAIFINPNSVDQLVDAIIDLKENENKRKILAEKSLKIAKDRTIESRAVKIINWIESQIN